MIRNHCRAILAVELLEDRCTPAPVATGPAAIAAAQPTINFETRLSLIRGVTPSLLAAPVAPPSSAALFGHALTTPSIQGPTLSPFAYAPIGAGAVPLNNSIPNGAAVLSGSAGLAGLSPFLPTYYLNYTQTGPFYTGSGGVIPPASDSSSSSDQSQAPVSTPADSWFLPGPETTLVSEEVGAVAPLAMAG